jgi:hypothetical protein
MQFRKIIAVFNSVLYHLDVLLKHISSLILIIHHHYFPLGSQLEHRAPFGASVITHTIIHTVGLLWTSDQPVTEASTYTGQHNI